MRKYTDEQKNELEAQVKRGDSDIRFFKRVQAVYWRAHGQTAHKVKELSGYSSRALCDLCKAYADRGLDGLRPRPAGSNNRKLTYEQEAAVLAELSSEIGGRCVRAFELSELFKEKAGVGYGIHAFYRLLHRHGWRRVMPRGQHPKAADEETCEAAKKLT